jgi:hypothetical protein
MSGPKLDGTTVKVGSSIDFLPLPSAAAASCVCERARVRPAPELDAMALPPRVGRAPPRSERGNRKNEPLLCTLCLQLQHNKPTHNKKTRA